MIYFDNSATTEMALPVLDSYTKVSQQYYANPSSLHEKGETAASLLDQSRKRVAKLLGVSSEEIVFTSGGTEGDNWVIKGTAFEKMTYGKHLITTSIEHPAVLEAYRQLERMGWDVTYLPVDETGIISLIDLKSAVKKETVLVSVMAVNNETGSIQPIEEIGEYLKAYPTVHFHVDAVQAIGKVPVKLGADSRIDMAVFSAHKFHGPKGVGIVYVKKGKKLSPLLSGGGQEGNQRSGTENLPGIVSATKALNDVLQSASEDRRKMMEMITTLKHYLSQLNKVNVYTPETHAPHILCFGIRNIKGEVVVHALEKHGITVSTTSACSSKKQAESSTLLAMGIAKKQAETAIRVSLSRNNSMEEMEKFIESFEVVYRGFYGIH
ncbi:cysteine desulfurase family protein [Marinilactibacillus kalidii]|uniref:cysteine desulfurase family protein n=1 Tax=Marinilactibacillus kalidii TaxID=2820274 RepID=UPI001ABECC2A|nr:cysteine desulfurase family protein [Marinilactibacillus kalidii]